MHKTAAVHRKKRNVYAARRHNSSRCTQEAGAAAHTAAIMLAYIKLLHEVDKLPARRQLAKLMEQLDICQHHHHGICTCRYAPQNCICFALKATESIQPSRSDDEQMEAMH